MANPDGGEQLKVKSFDIQKHLVYQAWKKVQANGGAPGVDAVSIAEFMANERSNLFKLWNHMSSGSYMPGPIRAVEIPKDHGAGVRVLGVPNVADRVAQSAVAILLEEKLEPIFHPDSYGYRPGRSAHDALAVARKRCWRKDWVVDLDIQAFFDSVPHDLVMKAVSHHTQERWVLLYIERWLVAPIQMPDGTLLERDRGTSQGSPISPLLANLFMHYAFDRWMSREYSGSPFERYADDIVIHLDTQEQAIECPRGADRSAYVARLEAKPRQDEDRVLQRRQPSREFETHQFRLPWVHVSRSSGQGAKGYFLNFAPAISNQAKKAVGKELRSLHLNRRSGTDLSRLAMEINPMVRGWINYYGAFYRPELYFLVQRTDEHLVRWAMQKFKRLKGGQSLHGNGWTP